MRIPLPPSSLLQHASPYTIGPRLLHHGALDSFTTDPIFSAFLSPDFNPAQISSAVLSVGFAASRIEKLQEGLHLLFNQLCHEFLSYHKDLINHLFPLKAFESSLSSLRSSLSSLKSGIDKLNGDIIPMFTAPYHSSAPGTPQKPWVWGKVVM